MSAQLTTLHSDAMGEGPPVLLLHSAGMSGRQWRPLAMQLRSAGYRAVMPDLTGHGASPPWPEPAPFSFRTDVAHAVRMLRRLGSAHLIGHSYGGLVALHAALDASECVRSLSLFDPVAFGVLDETLDHDACAALGAAKLDWDPMAGGSEAWLEGFIDFWGGAGAWAALREPTRVEFRRIGWVVREGVRSLMTDRTPAATYSTLTCPTLLLTGARTPLPERRVMDRLAAAMPLSHLVVIPDAGHLAPVTHMHAVNDRVLAHIARVTG